MCVCVFVCVCMYVHKIVLVCIKCQQLENLDDTTIQSSISISLMSKVVIGADHSRGTFSCTRRFDP